MGNLTGEFVLRNADDAWAVQREDGSWLLDGLIPIPELKDRLGLKSVLKAMASELRLLIRHLESAL